MAVVQALGFAVLFAAVSGYYAVKTVHYIEKAIIHFQEDGQSDR